MKKPTALLATIAACLTLILAGCGTTATSGDNAPTGSNASESDQSGSTSSDEAAEDSGDSSDEPAAFGQTFTYEDGLAVTVSKPMPFTPSDVAAGGENNKTHRKFQITIVNGTKKVYDPVSFSTTLQSGDTDGDEVFDDSTGAPETKLLPGRQAKFTVAYGLDNPNDLVLQVDPDYGEHATVIYQQST